MLCKQPWKNLLMRYEKVDVGIDCLMQTLLVQGDIQMCAMLALVAADELHISKPRVTRFVEGYVGKVYYFCLQVERPS